MILKIIEYYFKKETGTSISYLKHTGFVLRCLLETDGISLSLSFVGFRYVLPF